MSSRTRTPDRLGTWLVLLAVSLAAAAIGRGCRDQLVWVQVGCGSGHRGRRPHQGHGDAVRRLDRQSQSRLVRARRRRTKPHHEESLSIDVTTYHNPACGTSRNTLALIRNPGIEPTVIEYLQAQPSYIQLARMIADAGLTVREAIRDTGTPYTDIGLDKPYLTEGQLLEAMLHDLILINRPFVVSAMGTRLVRTSEVVGDIPPNNHYGSFIKKDGAQVLEQGRWFISF